ncbi:MAG TPA: GDP-mannose 4,6-dehydratase [Candidatus Sumerlaeota bacterium]|nr:GDP-mannose 4,6-dehydratase [Candidatus Sumerlaeota bacterium]
MPTKKKSPFPFRRVLITGGAGFIGSHLADRLLADGAHVEIIDDLSTGSVFNVDHLRKNKNFDITIASILNESKLAECVDRADAIVHLAAAVGVRLIVENPVRTIETNLNGTENVLRAAMKKKKPVLVASTSEVYGKRQEVPFREDDDLVLGASRRPRWAYACSKLMDEFLALAHWRENKMPVVIARLFNTVGPRQTGMYGMVIPRLTSQALAGKPLTIYGDGSQTRTFCHVTDAVEGLAGLLADQRTYGAVYNLGGTGEISIRDLAQLILRKTRSKSKLNFIPFEKAYDGDFEDMQRRVPDLTKINKAIGYKPRRDIEKIIEDVIAFEKGKTRRK